MTKKHFLSACLLLAAVLMPFRGWADVVIDEANFPDAAFRAVLTDLPEGQDGVLTDEEIAGLKKLVMDGTGRHNEITSLKGIEHLTELGELHYSGANKLKELDLRKNKALSFLWLDYASLDRLELSGLPNLFFIHFEAVFGIKELDLSGCTGLMSLYCKLCDFEQFNIQDCTKLGELSCEECKLLGLDLLPLQELRNLFCCNNQLTSLDVSCVPGLDLLDCGMNPLGSIDLTRNTALRGLWCPDNNLTALDLSQNTQLCFLNCARNYISTEDMTALVNSLPQPTGGGRLFLQDRGSDREHNTCTEEQENMARAKNWTVLYELPISYGGADHTLGVSVLSHALASPSGAYHTLCGQRLPSAPTQKGLYIQNGRKVVVK